MYAIKVSKNLVNKRVSEGKAISKGGGMAIFESTPFLAVFLYLLEKDL